jgi:pimeloyl-ACP methyl ester carboxylesterase
MGTGYAELPNELVSAANGVDYAYRDTGGEGEVPLVLLPHFRGNLDNWDPALIDALATARRVVTFDNAGVGGSTGTTPATIGQMALDAIAFIAAMEFGQADLPGFSISSFVAQQIALTRPALVRRLVLASSAPQGAAGPVLLPAGRPDPARSGEDLPRLGARLPVPASRRVRRRRRGIPYRQLRNRRFPPRRAPASVFPSTRR